MKFAKELVVEFSEACKMYMKEINAAN